MTSDVETAFLNSSLNEKIYVDNLYPNNKNAKLVCKLIKALYRLKQASAVWNATLHNVLLKIGFKHSLRDKCLYKWDRESDIKKGKKLYVTVYVDAILFASSDENSYQKYLSN